MKRYSLSGADGFSHVPEYPERTARRGSRRGLDFDVYFQVWPNRKALARSIRMQEKRERRQDDWTACVPLGVTEGY